MRLTTPTEQQIQKAILDYLNAVGWAVKVTAGGARRGEAFIRLAPVGTPDLIGVVSGRMVAVECKRPGGKLRPGQGETIDRINRRGGLAFVATSVEDVVRALRAEGLV